MQRASLVRPAVLGGDRGDPDPVLQAFDGLAVAAPDLGIDRGKVVGGECEAREGDTAAVAAAAPRRSRLFIGMARSLQPAGMLSLMGSQGRLEEAGRHRRRCGRRLFRSVEGDDGRDALAQRGSARRARFRLSTPGRRSVTSRSSSCSAQEASARSIGRATRGSTDMVALKVLPEEFLESEERKARFEREAQLLASLNHPAIAVLYSFEEIPGSSASSPARHVLVMELVEGKTLHAALANGPLSAPRPSPIAIQIAEALAEAHRAGILHRDVKSGNVMLTLARAGEGPRLRPGEAPRARRRRPATRRRS